MKYLLVLFLFMISCASYTTEPDPKTVCGDVPEPADAGDELEEPCITCNKYTVQLDYSFDKAQVEQINNAWDTWTGVIGNKIDSEVINSCKITEKQFPCQIKVLKKDPPPGYAGYCYWKAYVTGKTYAALITIHTDLEGDYLYRVALHEFGHALNLSHSPDINSVMYYTSPVNKLSCEDKTRVCKNWGCNPNCK